MAIKVGIEGVRAALKARDGNRGPCLYFTVCDAQGQDLGVGTGIYRSGLNLIDIKHALERAWDKEKPGQPLPEGWLAGFVGVQKRQGGAGRR